jgi:flagellar motility protein MotE (MotC chaperone)
MQNIRPVNSSICLDAVLKIHVREFDWHPAVRAGTQRGIVAQELEVAVPHAVTTSAVPSHFTRGGVEKLTVEATKMITHDVLVVELVGAAQALHTSDGVHDRILAVLQTTAEELVKKQATIKQQVLRAEHRTDEIQDQLDQNVSRFQKADADLRAHSQQLKDDLAALNERTLSLEKQNVKLADRAVQLESQNVGLTQRLSALEKLYQKMYADQIL